MPLIHQRRILYNRWAASGCVSDHALFAAARSEARAEVHRAKNQWLYSLAEQVDLGHSSCNGASVWASIRTIQRSYQGIRSVTVCTIKTSKAIYVSLWNLSLAIGLVIFRKFSILRAGIQRQVLSLCDITRYIMILQISRHLVSYPALSGVWRTARRLENQAFYLKC